MPIRPENRLRYPINWAAISHRIRFARARGRCECRGECGRVHAGMNLDPYTKPARCEAIHGQPAETGSTVVLTVAHLDHTPENVHDDNLKAMCQRCHLAYDGNLHQKNAAETRARKAKP